MTALALAACTGDDPGHSGSAGTGSSTAVTTAMTAGPTAGDRGPRDGGLRIDAVVGPGLVDPQPIVLREIDGADMLADGSCTEAGGTTDGELVVECPALEQGRYLVDLASAATAAGATIEIVCSTGVRGAVTAVDVIAGETSVCSIRAGDGAPSPP